MTRRSKAGWLRVFTLFLIMFGMLAWGDAAKIAEAKQLIKKQDYKAAKDILIQATISRKLDAPTKADAHMTLGLLYRNFMGDLDLARIQFQRIARLKLPSTHPLKAKAKNELDSLLRDQKQFAAQYKILKEVSRYTEDAEVQQQYLSKLETILKEQTDFPGIGQANYWYGHYLDKLGRHFEAMAAYEKAKSKLPAITEVLAVNSSYKLAAKEAGRTTLPIIFWSVIVGVFLIGGALFVHSKPKTWMKSAHFKLLGRLLMAWLGLFLLISAVLFFVDLNNENLGFFRPVFVRKLWYQKGGFRLLTVLLHGGFVLAGVFLVSAGSAKWKSRAKRLVVTILAGLSLGIAFSGNYYVNYLMDDSQYKDGLLGGTMYTLIATNKHDMPKDLAAVKEMVGSGEKKQIRELLEYYLELDDDARDLSKYMNMSDDEIAELLFKKAKEKESR